MNQGTNIHGAWSYVLVVPLAACEHITRALTSDNSAPAPLDAPNAGNL
jgi:hypothetical protein